MAQNVGVSGNTGYTPYTGAILDLDNSGGLLLPRLTTTERDNLGSTFTPTPSNAEGMMIYNRTSDRYEMWVNDGGWGWKKVMTESDLGNGFINNTNITAGLQTPASFEISGSGLLGTTLGVGTSATIGTTLSVGNGMTVGAVGTPGNILMSVDDSWIGRGSTITSPRVAFNTATEVIAISPVGSAIISVLKANVSHTALSVNNTGAASGVGIKLSGARNLSTGEVGYIDFENNDGGLATLARVSAKNASSNNTNGSFQIALLSGGTMPAANLEQLRLAANGDLVINGKFTSNGIKETSDGRFKKNINSISNALSTVLNLEGVTYNWRTQEFPQRSFTDRMEYGVIAQQIEKFVPELVSTNEDGYKSVQYSHMVPLLIEAIKEQQLIINSQSQEIGVLKASVDAISEHIKTAEK